VLTERLCLSSQGPSQRHLAHPARGVHPVQRLQRDVDLQSIMFDRPTVSRCITAIPEISPCLVTPDLGLWRRLLQWIQSMGYTSQRDRLHTIADCRNGQSLSAAGLPWPAGSSRRDRPAVQCTATAT
jgi:hypothetical protein